MSRYQHILTKLPYSSPFLFVDELVHVDENGIEGTYRFRQNEYFYMGHFRNKPVTPGVILTECMAQIGLVSLGISLLETPSDEGPDIAFTSANVEFLRAVLPGAEVRVKAQKLYWRLGKLKVSAEMYNESRELVCKGELSGMIKRKNL